MPVSEMVEETINRMLIGNSSLPEIEAFIERQPISEEEKSALWLWAWAEQPRTERQRTLLVSERIRAGV